MFKQEAWALLVRGRRSQLRPAMVEPNGIIVRDSGLVPRYFGWFIKGGMVPEMDIEHKNGLIGKNQLHPLYVCVIGEALPRIINIPINPKELGKCLKGEGKLLDNIRTTQGTVNNEIVHKLIRGQVADAVIDQKDDTLSMITGMLFGGMYTLVIVRPDIFQGPFGIFILMALMGAMMLIPRRG